jgi:hypothetical protein
MWQEATYGLEITMYHRMIMQVDQPERGFVELKYPSIIGAPRALKTYELVPICSRVF